MHPQSIVIECPFYRGQFDICAGKALFAPIYGKLKTYLRKVQNKRISLQIS